MQQVERHTVRSAVRVGYVFAVPFVLLVSLYLIVFLGLNSRQGSEALSDVLTDVLHGGVEFSFLRVGPDLLTVEVYDTTIRDVFGRPTIEARAARCRFRPDGLVRRRLLFDGCVGRDGRVLIMSYENGAIGFMTAFEGRFRPKAPGRDPMVLMFDDVTFENVDVLVHLRDATLRFDSVDVRNGRVEAIPGRAEIDADMSARGGRIVMAERALVPTDRRATWDEALWDIQRRNRPWVASYSELPAPTDDSRGFLALDLDGVIIDRFRWRGEAFEFDRLAAESDALSLDAVGALRLVPERPKVPPRERGVIMYEGRAAFSLPPDSPVLDFALPGVFDRSLSPDEGPSTIEPITFRGYGTVRFFEGDTRLRLHDVQMLGWNLTEVDAGLRWQDGVVTLADDAIVRAWGGTLTGGGRIGAHDGRWQLRLCADDVRTAAIARPWRTDDPNLDAILSTTPARCTPGEPAGVQLEGDLTRKGLGLAFAATTPEDFEAPAPLIMGSADGLQLRWRRRPEWLPDERVRLDIGATLTTRGELRFERTDGAGVRLRSAGDTITMDGGIVLPTEELDQLRIGASTNHFERWLGLFVDEALPEDVSLVTRFVADGPWSAPRIERLELTFDKQDDDTVFPAFSLTGDLQVLGDTLVIRDGLWSSDLGTARARGTVLLLDGSVFRPRRRPEFDMNFALTDVDLGRIAPGAGVDARFDATFSLRGRPGDLRVLGSRLEAIDFRLLGEPVDYLSADTFELGNDVIAVSDLFVVKGKGLLEADLRLDLDNRTIDADVRGERFRLQEFRLLDALDADLRGRVDVVAHVAGDFDAPRLSGSAVIEDLEAFRLAIGGAAFTFATFEEAVEVAGALTGDINVAARVPWDGSPWSVSAGFHRVAIQERVPALQDAIDRSALSGRAVATVDLGGEVPISARLFLEDMELVLSGRDFDIARPAQLAWELRDNDPELRHLITLDELAIGTEGRYLRAGGSLEVPPEGAADVRFVVAGDTDLSLLRFIPSLVVDAEGPAEVDLKVFGTTEDPGIEGAITLGESRIAPRGLGTSVYLEPGTVEVSSSALTFPADRPLTGTVFGGDFTLTGDIGLARFLPASLDLRAFVTNLTYRVPDELNATLTGDLRFRAGALEDFDTWTLSGAVEIVDARWYGDVEVVGGSLSFGGFGRTVETFQLPVWRRVDAIEQLRADLLITGRDRLRVDNRIADAEMELEFRTDLRLTGPLGEMVVVGEMEALDQGTVTYRGRQFDVTRATLFFEGQRDPMGYPMPRLESELEASIRPCVRRAESQALDAAALGGANDELDNPNEVYIVAQVDGQLPYELTFDLESTPFYDQRDLLSLILTGCTVDELTAGDAGGRTLEVVLRPFLDAVERNVEERLELEDVELVPAIGGSAGITIQDEVSERFTWTFDAVLGSGDESQQVIRGAYRLFDWLSIELQEQTSNRETLLIDGGVRFRVELD